MVRTFCFKLREKGADERVLNMVGDQATPAIITEIERDAKSSGGS